MIFWGEVKYILNAAGEFYGKLLLSPELNIIKKKEKFLLLSSNLWSLLHCGASQSLLSLLCTVTWGAYCPEWQAVRSGPGQWQGRLE